MFIVGSRLHAIPFHNIYSELIPNINDRLLVKSGITRLTQINGLCGDIEYKKQTEQKTKVDWFNQYINNYSFNNLI